MRLGILGGGQLGRMSAMAAARLGIETCIFTDQDDSPASQVSAKTFVAPYNDEDALKAFANEVDIITYEFENIPIDTVQALKKRRPVHPDESLLKVSQNRVDEKQFLNDIGINTTRWCVLQKPADAQKFIEEEENKRFVIKTTRFGYDGKGQAFVNSCADIEAVWPTLQGEVMILEEAVQFECELSVIIARNEKGNTALYGPMINTHKNHILHKTEIPCPLSKEICDQAIQMTKTLAERIDLIGVLTVEYFLTTDHRLLANEIAPRTHNSGHWSIDACPASQFENHVRAVCGLPLGDARPHSAATMINLIGDDIDDSDEYLQKDRACLHLYGKKTVREGRKMGHVTLLSDLKN